MLRTRYHAIWLSLNFILCFATLAVVILGSYWTVNDSGVKQQHQADRIQGIVNEALELGKGNPKTLERLLAALPGSPMFDSLEIHDQGTRIIQVSFDSPQPPQWQNTLPLPPAAPMERLLNAKNPLTIKLCPAEGFAASRLSAMAPVVFVAAASVFLLVNLVFWLLKKRFNFTAIDESRWAKVVPADQSKTDLAHKAEQVPDNILDCLPDAILRCNVNGQILYRNATAREWMAPGQQANILDLIAPWDRARCAELLANAYHPGNLEFFETQIIGIHRGIMPVTVSFALVPDHPDELILVLHDATANRLLQDKLDIRDLLLNTIPQGLAVLSPRGNGELLYGNQAFKDLLQINDASPRSGRWLDSMSSQAPAHIAEQIQSAISQMTKASIDIPLQSSNHSPHTLQLQLFPVAKDDPQLVCMLRDCTEETVYRQRLERELAIRRIILDEMPVGFCITDAQAKINVVNAAFAKLTTTSPQQLIGSPITSWLPKQSAREHLFQREYAFQVKNESRFARINSLPLTTQEGKKEHVYFFEDITPFKQQALSDVAALDRMQRTLDSIADGIITTNENGFIQYMNPYAQKLTGLTEHQYKGIPFGQAIQLIDEKKREPLVDPAIRAIRIGKTVKFRQDVLYLAENKQDLAVEISATPVCDSIKTMIGAVVVIKDVAEQRSLNQQMQMRASRDPLTGLINRRELLSLLEGLQYEVDEQFRQHTLCYMDLDKFKIVNDTCGHNAGDELLRQVSNLMNDCLRTSDVLARIGGDEFCAVLFNTPVGNARLVAEKIREAVKRFRFTWDDKFFEIGVSIGLFGLLPGLNVEDTICAADQACYQAKEEGRDCVYISSASKPGAEKPILTPWSERLAEALDHDYFRLFRLDAQTLETGQSAPNYHEVRLQLHEPHQVPLIASAFMPNAHRLNLTASIERWVIGKLFSSIGSWSMDNTSEDIFAIQLSAITLAETSFITFLSEQSKRHGVAAKRICFEIAEDDLVQNFSAVQRFMQEGKKTGYGFCLSRFGGGISSFAYLRNLPLDFLKIDSSLTYRLASDPIDSVIVHAILAIGEHMHIRVITQHVQDPTTRDLLTSLGIHYIQQSNNDLIPLEPARYSIERAKS